MTEQELKEWNKVRDKALLTFDLNWARKQIPIDCPIEDTDEVLILSMHQIRYEIPSLPADARLESRDWLKARGYTRWKGMPWLPGDQLP